MMIRPVLSRTVNYPQRVSSELNSRMKVDCFIPSFSEFLNSGRTDIVGVSSP